MPLTLMLNGQSRNFPNLSPSATLNLLVTELGLQGDRVAIEHDGEIVPRAHWTQRVLNEGDKLEVVHFVGGGTAEYWSKANGQALLLQS
jgi:sulfur carrier protein